MNKYYTMIGSRSTPDTILEIMKDVATKLDSKGWYARSGGANGADSACNHVKHKEIYLPWNGFNGHYHNPSEGYYDYKTFQRKHEADAYMMCHHKYWSSVKRESVKHLHRRNVHQVLGNTLNSPSKIVICYAEPDSERGKHHVKGGTGTAVSLAISFGIPICNLYDERNIDRLYQWIDKL